MASGRGLRLCGVCVCGGEGGGGRLRVSVKVESSGASLRVSAAFCRAMLASANTAAQTPMQCPQPCVSDAHLPPSSNTGCTASSSSTTASKGTMLVWREPRCSCWKLTSLPSCVCVFVTGVGREVMGGCEHRATIDSCCVAAPTERVRQHTALRQLALQDDLAPTAPTNTSTSQTHTLRQGANGPELRLRVALEHHAPRCVA